MSEVTELQLDLTASEVIVVTMLANMGASLLGGDEESVRSIGKMLMLDPEIETIALGALEKLEASLRLAKQMAQGSGGLT